MRRQISRVAALLRLIAAISIIFNTFISIQSAQQPDAPFVETQQAQNQSASRHEILNAPDGQHAGVASWFLSMVPASSSLNSFAHRFGLRKAALPAGTLRQDFSRVDYRACCGLGHRLIRMANAHHVAKKMSFELKPDWGYCGKEEAEGANIFDHLFLPQSLDELAYVNSTHQHLFFGNEVAGYEAAGVPWKGVCHIHDDKIETDFEMYTSLRNRFRERHAVDRFVEQHFAGRTVLGIHIRAGNGEAGHFNHSARAIQGTPQQWISNLVTNMLLHLEAARQNATRPIPPPILYVASDTQQYIDLLKARLKGYMPVVYLAQDRPKQGEGVFFGEFAQQNKAQRESDQKTCLQRWTSTVHDMMLLSYADVLIAGKPSSFTQSLPLSMVFGKKHRKLDAALCEVHRGPSGQLNCFKSYREWACDTKTHKGRFAVMPMFLQPGGFEKIIAKLQPPRNVDEAEAAIQPETSKIAAKPPDTDVSAKKKAREALIRRMAMLDKRERELDEMEAMLVKKEAGL